MPQASNAPIGDHFLRTKVLLVAPIAQLHCLCFLKLKF